MKAADIRELTEEELIRALDESRRETLNLRLQAQTGQLENTARVRLVRRDGARLLTEQAARAGQQK
ncbi:MAG: 50S ribosomal protein L29 [Lentisphaerae bacterium]|jgi:large subunit ribosomal protein L29|nr:50S ribosomal protein L29 [Lentisphaerota bacterium]MBT4819148.1 50S ribosomal protein L29 [Lentisphaerota bacterium]MBT5607357.1 50S ribosomal protein L29 [Lentisphaerota bacterium]MBT7058367.1 50S ribosomal protein L29 [Lentisphaerota bacterium]MBT7841684.1 50S ribosomal protein L29 [Lentisphaerota bacterium]